MKGSWKKKLIPGLVITAAGIAALFYVNRLESDILNKVLAFVFLAGVLGGPAFIASGTGLFLYIAGSMGVFVLVLTLPKPYSAILSALCLGGALMAAVLRDQRKKRAKPKRMNPYAKSAPGCKFTARRLALCLNLVSVAVFVTCLFLLDMRTYPWGMALCLALPLAGFIAYTVKPGICLYERKGNAKTSRGSVMFTLLLPCAAMFFRAVMDHNLLSYTPVWPYTLGLWAAGMVLFLLSTREYRERPPAAIAAAVFLLVYSYCAVVQVNCAFDFAAPAMRTATVESMSISRGSRSPDRYHVFVSQENGTWDLMVSKEEYAKIGVGDTVDVAVYPGTLGIPHAYIALK